MGYYTGTALPPWHFGYQDSGVSLSSRSYGTGKTEGQFLTYADFTGDARQDVLLVKPRQVNIGTSKDPIYVKQCALKVWVLTPGNGLTERAAPFGEDRCNPDSESIEGGDDEDCSFRTGDFDGDGKADIVEVGNLKAIVWLARWDGQQLSYARHALLVGSREPGHALAAAAHDIAAVLDLGDGGLRRCAGRAQRQGREPCGRGDRQT